MHLSIKKFKNGRTHLTIVEKYWDKKDKKIKERVVETIGYADKYLDLYDDPVEHFKEEVNKRNIERLKEKEKVTLNIDTSVVLDTNTDDIKNIGYGIIKNIYKELEIDKFFRNIEKKEKTSLPLEKIFELLVFSRIIYPASKRDTFNNKHKLYEEFDGFNLDDVYRALDYFTKYDKKLCAHLYKMSKDIYKRETTVGYFDCTNYYYDISRPDIDEFDDDGNLLLKRYRKYGPEKNHRKDPIIEMGLFMDTTGIPLSYGLFSGNESEKVNMLPIIKKTKIDFGLNRMIVVADRGLNTSNNIYKLNGDNKSDNNVLDGYVYGQTVRGADKEFKEWVLKQDDYIITKIKNEAIDEDDTTINDDFSFKHKSRIYPKKISVDYINAKGKEVKRDITVDQKQLVYFSHKYAKKQKLDRQRCIDRAKDLIEHPKKYDKAAAKGASGYVLNISFNPDTGEVIAKDLKLDKEKIEEEEKYDGYYSIVTSELKMDDLKMREIYRGLIKIEDTFKVTKSELDTRPIFVRTNEHIESHFTTCFTSLVLIRLLERKLDNKYPTNQILNSLRNYNCINIGENKYQFVYYDLILDDIANKYNLDLSKKYKTQLQIRRLLKY